MRRNVIVLLALASFTAASVATFSCSDSDPATTPPIGTEGGSTTDGPGGNNETGTPDDSSVKPDALGTGTILLNEISPAGEWVELQSIAAAGADISGYVIADRSKDGGGPKLGESLKIPPGTVLPPKAFVIVQGGGLDGGGKKCPDGGQSFCFNAEFGISKSGEAIYLLDPSGAIVGEVTYPGALVDAGETWGRLPSGDPAGVFQLTDKTPGAANKKP